MLRAPRFCKVIIAIGLCSFGVAALGQPILYSIHGQSEFSQLGYAVSDAGDVNGDGYADVIVGAYNYNNFAGQARVISGVNGNPLYNWNGVDASDNVGWSVSGAGDVNADGYADVIVGAVVDAGTGTARVYSGVNGSLLYLLSGDSNSDEFGYSVSGAGDVNNDGYADVVVGAWRDDNSATDSGMVRVYSGASGAVLYTFNGDAANNQLGVSVSGAGDVNKDGYADIIVGSLNYARIYSGANGTQLRNWVLLARSVSAAGDVNKDTYPDVVVGNGSNLARVYSGANGAILYSFAGDGTADNFGYSVSAAGDVDNDGYADIIVGAQLDDNTGADTGMARVFSGKTGSILYTFNGDNEWDYFGGSVSSAGDVNGDSYADVIVGARYNDYTGTQAGMARVFSGKGLWTDTDSDGQNNVVDTDDDNDGVLDITDPNPVNPAISGDSDSDGVDNSSDNCVSISNSDQLDSDGDSQGNACDTDDDNDGILDVNDNCPVAANPDQTVDTDGDAMGDICDSDPLHVTQPSAIDLGAVHGCVLVSGGMRCWGFNGHGQLVDGTRENRSTPTNINDLSGGVIAISSGASTHSCALTGAGAVKCWGHNNAGQVGGGTSGGGYSPVDVIGLNSDISAIAAAGEHSCALMSAGAVKCWGANYEGQLGDGSITDRYTPVDVFGLNGGVSAIATGNAHTCALTTAGGVKCWGFGGYGQLGNGIAYGYNAHVKPVDVIGLGNGVSAIATGSYHTCALTTAGGVKCWGLNTHGQLGIGTLGDGTVATEPYDREPIPVDVSGLSGGVTAIAMGNDYTCALTAVGGVKCWGTNNLGQLGDGTTISRTTPVDVIGLSSGVSAIAAGRYHACALTMTGAVKCWGYNSSGQLGDGTQTQRSTPLAVTGFPGDSDADGLGDNVDFDDDNDSILDVSDNCPFNTNVDQLDTDGDFQGNACDLDDDNDATPDASDNCSLNNNASQTNTDGDAQGDICDTDDDNDGLPDTWEQTYGLNPLVNDAAGDLDGDGFTNLDEYTNNTDPTVPDVTATVDNDFDNDSDADILIRSTSSGAWRLFAMNNGISSSNSAYGAYSSTAWTLVASEDFDADGDTDVLLRNTSTGAWRMFITQNGMYLSDSNFAAYANTTWSVASVADYNGDGTKDILLKSATAWRVFYVVNGAVSGDASMALYTTGWELKYDGDIDGDGDADIILRRASDGYWRQFTVAGGVVASNSATSLYQSLDWQLQFYSDLDADGDDDIVLRSTSAKNWRTFAVTGGVVGANTKLSMYENAAWSFNHLNDVDADGDDDIILRSNTGGWRLFITNGLDTPSNSALGLYASSQWIKADVLDLNGDGTKDVLLNNTTSGAWRAFMISGGTVSSDTNPGLYQNTDWTLQDK